MFVSGSNIALFSITLQAGHENVRLIEPKIAKQSLAVYDKGKYIML